MSNIVNIGIGKVATFYSDIGSTYTANTLSLTNLRQITDTDPLYTVSPSPASLTTITVVRSGLYEVTLGCGLGDMANGINLRATFSSHPNFDLSTNRGNTAIVPIPKTMDLVAGEVISIYTNVNLGFTLGGFIFNTLFSLKRIG